LNKTKSEYINYEHGKTKNNKWTLVNNKC